MDNIFCFKPLWTDENIAERPTEALREIRAWAYERALNNPVLRAESSPDIEDLVDEAMSTTSHLLADAIHTDNDILLRLRAHAELVFDGDHFTTFETLLCLWYISIIPVLARDHAFQDPIQDSLDSSLGTPEEEEEQSEASDKIDEFGCLGIMAMLFTAENWTTQKKVGAVVANSTTSMIFAAFLICFHAEDDELRYIKGKLVPRNAIKTFLQCNWQLARIGHEAFDGRPGQEFGALPDEAKVSTEGKRLLTKVGTLEWEAPPFWHPFKKAPGSAWNKFLKNIEQPVFTSEPSATIHVSHRLPTSAIKLVKPFENYYQTLKERFDQTGRDRRILEIAELEHQHNRLASSSGLWYPSTPLDITAARDTFIAPRSYENHIPLIKGPITDLKGNLTMTFLTRAIRALRLNEEPDEDVPLGMLRFGSREDGDFS